MSREPDPWSRARRILAVRLDAFGDVLMTGPALQDLKAAGGTVTLLTSASGAEAARMMPYVDDVIVFTAPWMKAGGGISPAALAEMADRLAALKFDAAVIFTVYTQNPLPAAMLCYLAGIPLRLAHCRENPYALLTHWVPDADAAGPPRHEVERQQALVAHAGVAPTAARIGIAVSAEVRRSVRERLAGLGLGRGGSPWVVVHAGATAASRRYPPALFAAAVRRLQADWPGTAVFTGTPGEAELIREIRAAIPGPSVSLAGCLDTPALAALIGAAPLLISNNTGPAHLAAATGTPVVVLYALTNPQHTPWRVLSRVLFHEVPCRYCYKSVCPLGHGNCLTQVRPEQVAAAALELLSLPRPSLRAPVSPEVPAASSLLSSSPPRPVLPAPVPNPASPLCSL